MYYSKQIDDYLCLKYSELMPQIQDIHVRIMPETAAHLCQSTYHMVSLLLLVVTVIASNKQLLATDKQANHYQELGGQ